MTRLESVKRLLEELKHEVTMGLREGELAENIEFVFVVGASGGYPKGHVSGVSCRFEARPVSGLDALLRFNLK